AGGKLGECLVRRCKNGEWPGSLQRSHEVGCFERRRQSGEVTRTDGRIDDILVCSPGGHGGCEGDHCCCENTLHVHLSLLGMCHRNRAVGFHMKQNIFHSSRVFV